MDQAVDTGVQPDERVDVALRPFPEPVGGGNDRHCLLDTDGGRDRGGHSTDSQVVFLVVERYSGASHCREVVEEFVDVGDGVRGEGR